MAFREGCAVFGNAALGHSSVKFKPRRRRRDAEDAGAGEEVPENADAGIDDATKTPADRTAGFAETEVAAAATLPPPPALAFDDEEVVSRAVRVTEVLLQADPPAPSGVPKQGRIVSMEQVECFVAWHKHIAELRGFDTALPRVVYHWTAEKNFEGIVREGLRVPDGAGVAVKHGSSFGIGIYVSPDFRYGEEFFAYGAPAAFLCLALPGRQHFGKPPADGLGLGQADGYDSVIGRENQRCVDEWVFFRQGQLLPCFLVDRLGLVLAKDAVNAAIKELHRPWPRSSLDSSAVSLPPSTIEQVSFPDAGGSEGGTASRWGRRRSKVDAGATHGLEYSAEAPCLPDGGSTAIASTAATAAGAAAARIGRWKRGGGATSRSGDGSCALPGGIATCDVPGLMLQLFAKLAVLLSPSSRKPERHQDHQGHGVLLPPCRLRRLLRARGGLRSHSLLAKGLRARGLRACSLRTSRLLRTCARSCSCNCGSDGCCRPGPGQRSRRRRRGLRAGLRSGVRADLRAGLYDGLRAGGVLPWRRPHVYGLGPGRPRCSGGSNASQRQSCRHGGHQR